MVGNDKTYRLIPCVPSTLVMAILFTSPNNLTMKLTTIKKNVLKKKVVFVAFLSIISPNKSYDESFYLLKNFKILKNTTNFFLFSSNFDIINYVEVKKMNLKDYIAIVEDFPVKGISFKDITPLLQNGEAFKETCNRLANFAKEKKATVIVGPESRGFIFGCPIATNLGLGFVPIRKPGKLPREEIKAEYSLEYGKNTLCMHKDAIKKGDKVIIVDDLLATGGTVEAAISLVEQLGGEVVGCAFVIELTGLKGREQLNNHEVFSLIQYEF